MPAYFNDSQRQATKDAGKIAGLEVLRIINEPTAAALAYGLNKKGNETILVFDLGGGTFDVSVLEVGEGIFEVKSTSGDTHLGGDDFDKKIVDWIAAEFQKNESIDLRKDKQAFQRLTEAAEKAKIELSNTTQATINLPFITANNEGPKHLELTLTRVEFEKLCGDLFDRCRIPVEQALKDANLTSANLDEVVLVGGSSRIPAVQQLVRRITGKDPNQGVNPDEVVAIGAAIQGGVLAGEVKDVVLLDVTPLSLGVATMGDVMTKIIPRNTTIPVKKSEVFSTAADAQPSVEIHVLQGERQLVSDNKSLGMFQLNGIPAAPRGVPQIEVMFDIDANGLLSVTAKDKASGKEQSIAITGASTLAKGDVERMVRDAETHAEADRERRDQIDTKNNADSLVYQTEKQLKELNGQVSEEDKDRARQLVGELKSAIEHTNYDGMRSLSTDLQQALMQIGSAVYAQANAKAGNPNPPNPPSGQGSEDVVDADFVS